MMVFFRTRDIFFYDFSTLRLHRYISSCNFTVYAPNFVMMTSSNGNISRVTGHLCGNSPVPGEFPAQRAMTRSFDVFFDLCPNKSLSKQSWGWWFETPSHPLWRYCSGLGLVLFLLYIHFVVVLRDSFPIVRPKYSDIILALLQSCSPVPAK